METKEELEARFKQQYYENKQKTIEERGRKMYSNGNLYDPQYARYRNKRDKKTNKQKKYY